MQASARINEMLKYINFTENEASSLEQGLSDGGWYTTNNTTRFLTIPQTSITWDDVYVHSDYI